MDVVVAVAADVVVAVADVVVAVAEIVAEGAMEVAAIVDADMEIVHQDARHRGVKAGVHRHAQGFVKHRVHYFAHQIVQEVINDG